MQTNLKCWINLESYLHIRNLNKNQISKVEEDPIVDRIKVLKPNNSSKDRKKSQRTALTKNHHFDNKMAHKFE